MKILVDDFNHKVYEIGTIEKGIFRDIDPTTEIYKITNDKGIFYAVVNGFSVYDVDDIPENYSEYCYEDNLGFYRPALQEPTEQEKLRADVDYILMMIGE